MNNLDMTIINQVLSFINEHNHTVTNMNIDNGIYNFYVNSIDIRGMHSFINNLHLRYHVIVNICPDSEECFKLKDKIKDEVVNTLRQHKLSIVSEVYAQGEWMLNNNDIIELTKNEYYVRIKKMMKDCVDETLKESLYNIGMKYNTRIELQFI